MDQIDYISHKLMIIVGIIMYVLGIIGNIINIFVFTTWSCPRRVGNYNNVNGASNSPLYLLVSSIANLITVIYPLLTLILGAGYQYNVTKDNVFILCKIRYYALYTCDIISLTCVCIAIFDRYLISSRDVRLRQMSTTRKKTKLIILLIVCLNALHGIPLILYFGASNTGQCVANSSIYLYYYLFVFQILLRGFIPIIFLIVLGILTFKQLKNIEHANHIPNMNSDKQLSRMLLLMSISIILSSIPYCIEQFYYFMISNDNEFQSPQIVLLHIISSILFYTNPVCSFYIFYVSTPNFRKQVQKLIVCGKLFHHPFHNQVNAITN